MRVENICRRNLVGRLCVAAVAFAPLRAPALEAPTYSLKGIPGLSALTGADAPRPMEVGVLGRGMEGGKTGRLNCIASKVSNCRPLVHS